MNKISRFESVSVVLALILSPFWFYNLFNLNLGLQDLLLIAASITFTLRTGKYPILPNRSTFISICLFLFTAAVSLSVATSVIDAFLNFMQYVLIFIVVVPIAVYVFQDQQTRYIGILGLWSALNLLVLWGAYESLNISRLRHINLLYGNQNQLFWLISSAFILDLGVALDETESAVTRASSFLLAILALYMTLGGLTLSAILALVTGGWIIGACVARDYGKVTTHLYAFATLLTSVAGLVLVIIRWEWVFIQGSLESRFAQYTTAIKYGTQNQPFGIGLESSNQVLEGIIHPTSIHNFFLAYYLEIGVFGALAFTFILINWIRLVLVPAVVYVPLRLTEVAIISIFAAGVVIMTVQPVPVMRYWWLIYGLSWGIMHNHNWENNMIST